MRIVRRRKWALHRHVHLVDAFYTAHDAQPVTRMLAIGAGSGLSELFLAVTNPTLHIELTDVDMAPLDANRQMAEQLGITNVSYNTLDLLRPREVERYDFVSAIEVLEHIEDDDTAAKNLVDHAAHHAHILVPYCNDEELNDPRRRQREWERNEHFRPGYPQERFDAILGDAPRRVVRNCYLTPEATDFRAQVTELPDEQLTAQRLELTARALGDLRDVRVSGGVAEAQAIEGLLDLRSTVRPR